MTITSILWLAYFLSQIYSNYKSYKNLKLRYSDLETLERIQSIKKTIYRDIFFVFILFSEFLVPCISGIEIAIPYTYTSYNESRVVELISNKYNCTRLFVKGSMMELLSIYESLILFEALRQGILILHIRLYKHVLDFFIKEYRRCSFPKTFYFSVLVTCVQFVVVVVFSSFLETFVYGTTLSALFLLTNILSVAMTGKVLYMDLRCYLLEIRLIHTFDARNEYNRVLKMTKQYRNSIIIFTALLIILLTGFITYALGCIWLEWVFLIDCEKLNPYIKKFNISSVLQADLLEVSYFSRACISITGTIYFLGIACTSIALGWSLLSSWKRKQCILKPELRKHLI